MNVLYVEDNPLDADLTRHELTKSAPHVELDIVSSVHDAQARLDQTRYDIVLSDMRLPDGDGLALLTYIRDRGLPGVIILITASGDEETAVSALKAGADDYIVKRADYLARLPIALEDALERHRAETARLTRPLRVLYAEDNAIDIDLTCRHLARHAPHILVQVVHTAADVLQRLGEPGGHDHFDVLMMDYQLPDANALDLLRELRQVHRLDLPIVLVTGQGNEEIAVQALRLGVTDYVVKTANYLFRLPSALENAFHRAQLAREKAALRESEARYRLISELTSDLMYSLRVEPGGALAPEWSAGNLGDVTADTLQELTARETPPGTIYSDDLPVFRHHLETLQAGQPDVAEFRVMAPNGQVRWVRNYAKPVWDERQARVVRLYGAAQDMTDRKRTEQEIRTLNQALERRAHELDALYTASQAITSTLDLQEVLHMVMSEVRSLLDAEGASVLMRDPVNNDLFFAAASGPGAEQLAGLRIPITAGIAGWVIRERRPEMVADAQHDPRFYSRVDAVTGLTTRTLVAVPLRFQASVWGVVEAINKISGSFDHHDLEMLQALAGTAAIAIENARLYTSLQESNVQLRAAIQSKDEMLQNVSHELRTPLGLIYGYIEMMEDEGLGPLTAEQKHAIEIMHRQSDRLRFMVERLLVMQTFHPDKLKRIRLDMVSWLQQAVQPWEVHANRAGIRLVLDVPESLPPVEADPDYVSQVAENLLDNALKFSPRGGEMRVSAQVKGAEVLVAISDQGVGIPPDKLQQIFDRFYQVDGSSTRRFGGMGIGLALCRTIIEAHGGRIWAESQGQGHGSTFCFTLPIAAPGSA